MPSPCMTVGHACHDLCPLTITSSTLHPVTMEIMFGSRHILTF